MRFFDGGRAPRRPVVRERSWRVAPALAVALSVLVAGCGSEETGGGGRVIGDTLTVASLLPLSGPDAPAARQIVRGEKLALAEAEGRAGAFRVTFSSLDEGGAEPDQARQDAAEATRAVLSDSQVIAVIGSLRFEAAAVSVPLLNAAGMLHVSPTVGYPGFTTSLTSSEPERWYPSGRRTFVPIGGSDTEQAAVLLDAIRRTTGRARPRVAVERESGPEDEALAAAVVDAADAGGAIIAGDPASADAVVYAGNDVANAQGVAEGISREAPEALAIFGDDLARTDLPRRLTGAAARRAVFVSRAPRPGSTPALRHFARSFRARFGGPPGPYVALGYEAMRSVLRDGIARAGARANERGQVIDAYLGARRRTPSWSAFRVRGGAPAYFPVSSRPAP